MSAPADRGILMELRAGTVSFHQLTPPRWGGKRTGFAGSRQATENPVRRFPPGAPFPRKGPNAEAFVCFGGRVIRIPTAAEPLNVNSQLSNLKSFIFPLAISETICYDNTVASDEESFSDDRGIAQLIEQRSPKP